MTASGAPCSFLLYTLTEIGEKIEELLYTFCSESRWTSRKTPVPTAQSCSYGPRATHLYTKTIGISSRCGVCYKLHYIACINPFLGTQTLKYVKKSMNVAGRPSKSLLCSELGRVRKIRKYCMIERNTSHTSSLPCFSVFLPCLYNVHMKRAECIKFNNSQYLISAIILLEHKNSSPGS